MFDRMVALVKSYSSYEKEIIRKEGGKKAEWLKFVEEKLIKKGWDEE
ncbi:MAG: hypothetical protein KAS40_03810 [Desulfobacterales bacterium]|nr:hypothetical protein [Desulfobacterales bacterium]